MKIPVERLTETPTAFELEAGDAWWASHMPPHRTLPSGLAEPLRVRVWGHRMAEDEIYLEGTVEGELELECGRCLARYRHALREPFRLVLEPAGLRQPADPAEAAALARDGVCLGEDIEAGWYRGTQIDLGAFLLEVVALALPVKPLCREDCRGLCPRCGADRNQGGCSCPEIATHTPFAALLARREGTTRGDD
jgi:uncharacterized protein